MLEAQRRAQEEQIVLEMLEQQKISIDLSTVQHAIGLLRSQSHACSDSDESELPAGWTKIQNGNDVCYFNTLSGGTQADRPLFSGERNLLLCSCCCRKYSYGYLLPTNYD